MVLDHPTAVSTKCLCMHWHHSQLSKTELRWQRIWPEWIGVRGRSHIIQSAWDQQNGNVVFLPRKKHAWCIGGWGTCSRSEYCLLGFCLAPSTSDMRAGWRLVRPHVEFHKFLFNFCFWDSWSPIKKKESTLTNSFATTAKAPLLRNPLLGSPNWVWGMIKECFWSELFFTRPILPDGLSL